MLCSPATKGCRLVHGINPEFRKTFLVIHFSACDSPRDFLQRNSSDNVQRNREAVPLDLQAKVKTSLTSEDGKNYGTLPMPMCASRLLTTNSTIRVELPQNSVQQKSDLQFDKFSQSIIILVWKTRFKTLASNGSDFPSEAVLRIKEVNVVDSLDGLESSRSVYGNLSKN